MNHTVTVRLPESMYRCAAERAVFEGRATKSNPGIAGLMRSALRYYLSKNGYRAGVLDGEIVVEKEEGHE